MCGVDYEQEYDARRRVPEFEAILGRMAEEAKRYRETAVAAGRAELNVKYGQSPRQIVDIFWSSAGEDAPVAVFIHGGYWQALQPSVFSQLASGLNAHGVTVAQIGYDLCPQASLAAIVEQVRQACVFLWSRLQKPLLVHGHSAGGHLAACCLATNWQKLGAPKNLVPAAVGISGIYDLSPLIHTRFNDALKLSEDEAKQNSPLEWPEPLSGRFDAIVGGTESDEFFGQSRAIVEAWNERGVATRFQSIEGANHFDVIDPLTDPDSFLVKRLLQLLAVE